MKSVWARSCWENIFRKSQWLNIISSSMSLSACLSQAMSLAKRCYQKALLISHTSTWLRWASFEHVLLQSPQPREQTCDIVHWFLKLPPRSDTHHLCLYFIGQTKSHGYSYLRRGWRNTILTICLEDTAQEMFGDCTNDHSFSRYCRGMYAHPWTIRHGSTKRIISWKADSIGQEAE